MPKEDLEGERRCTSRTLIGPPFHFRRLQLWPRDPEKVEAKNHSPEQILGRPDLLLDSTRRMAGEGDAVAVPGAALEHDTQAIIGLLNLCTPAAEFEVRPTGVTLFIRKRASGGGATVNGRGDGGRMGGQRARLPAGRKPRRRPIPRARARPARRRAEGREARVGVARAPIPARF